MPKHPLYDSSLKQNVSDGIRNVEKGDCYAPLADDVFVPFSQERKRGVSVQELLRAVIVLGWFTKNRHVVLKRSNGREGGENLERVLGSLEVDELTGTLSSRGEDSANVCEAPPFDRGFADQDLRVCRSDKLSLRDGKRGWKELHKSREEHRFRHYKFRSDSESPGGIRPLFEAGES